MLSVQLAAAGPSLNPVSDLNQLTAYPFMEHALEAGTIVAVTSGLIGWFMVLRRQTFAGHTLSVMAFPGAAGALLVGLSASAGFFVFSGLAALAIGAARPTRSRGDRGQESAVTGTVQAFGLACGFLFLSLYQGVLGSYETLLFGSFLGITSGQVLALAVVAVVVVGLLALAGRPLLFASVDEGVARARGVPTRALGIGFLLLLGMAVAETAQITGALLVFALLVAPPATAQLLTSRTGLGLALSVLLGVVTVWLGLALAYFYEYPVGFYITTVAFVMYVLARLLRAALDGPRPLLGGTPAAAAAGAGAEGGG
jgi:zinc/manganese transport system permease protein